MKPANSDAAALMRSCHAENSTSRPARTRVWVTTVTPLGFAVCVTRDLPSDATAMWLFRGEFL
jgi:hypothetical protein